MDCTQLTDAELAAMRGAMLPMFQDECVISRLSSVADGQGGYTQTFAAIGTADCRIVAKTGTERLLAAQNNPIGNYTLSVPYDTTIAVADRVTVNSDNYRVVFVDDVNELRAMTRCDLNLEVS